jgi:hypothetical protein
VIPVRNRIFAVYVFAIYQILFGAAAGLAGKLSDLTCRLSTPSKCINRHADSGFCP